MHYELYLSSGSYLAYSGHLHLLSISLGKFNDYLHEYITSKFLHYLTWLEQWL